MPLVPSRSARLAALACLALALPAAAQDPGSGANPPPPPESIVCPAIEEDGLLCISDPMLMDGNCTSFVAAADRLGALYRAELQKMPGEKQSLLTTAWWGCGPDNLWDVKRLLVRLGNERANAVLATEPYKSLAPVPDAPPPPPPQEPFSCIDLQSAVDRNLCAGAKLKSVRAWHQLAFESCKSVVTPGPLLDELVTSEKAFEARLKPLCDADTEEAGESAKFQSFDRAQCLVQAYQERTNTMFDLHPECRPQN